MKHKSITVALITFLICMVLGNGIACTTPATEYVLDISSTEGGSVTEPGEGKFPYCQEQGESVNLVATPDAGYRFINWTGDVDTIADVDDPTTTITVNDNYSITANFDKVYDLTTSSTAGGSVSTPGEGTFTYDEGKVVDLVATPDTGYLFVNWTGDVDTITDIYDTTTAIKMNDDYSVIAKFKAIPEGEHSLTISSTAGGSVTTPGEGTFIYSEGDEFNLVATPDAGYQFVNWTGDVGTVSDSNAAITTITVNDDYLIMANFEEIVEYELIIYSIEGGSVTIPGEGTFIYNEGDEVNLVATPDAGYRFVNWTGDVGTIADVNAAVTIITINGDYDITANFLDP